VITHARVTNANDFPIDDRCNGVPIKFKPGVPETISIEAAALFFGFEMVVEDDGNVSVTFAPDWGYFARRRGWTNMEREKDETMNEMVVRVTRESAAKCAKIKVEPVTMRLREVVSEEEQLDPPRDAAPAIEPPAVAETSDEPRPARRGKMTV
jgi:hypothetical protein